MLRKRRPTDSGNPGSNHGPRESKKVKRVVDCMKVLLDVAKESADWLPPLKAVLGGVNALIAHYEQFKDVKEKAQELIPHLEKLKQYIITTTVDGDIEETNRRKELISVFERVERESQNILAKNIAARIVDKGEDSKLVVILIEELREAIVCYQVSLQQATYDQMVRLTSSFNKLLSLQEKPSAVRVKLESVVAQLDRLEDSPWKNHRHERWAKLIDDLIPIRDKAKGLYGRITSEGHVEDGEDTAAISVLAENLRNVLLEYWMAQQQAIYDQNCRLIGTAERLELNGTRRAKGAEWRHGNRRGCLKGTRETVLNDIESWAKDFDQSPVFWLNGIAGTGKTTIAQTVAECLFAEDHLGASFFCSRDFEDRSDLHYIFPSIAFQLAYKYPDFRSHFLSLLSSNPDIAHESLYRQMQFLIAEPLETIGAEMVIVIDALDECKDDEPSSAILSVLGRFVKRIPRVKFFVTGRPEQHIQTGFRLPLLLDSTDVFVLHDVKPSLINSDIRLFLEHELRELAQRRRLERWPSCEHIDLLCHRAAGLFVYAVATVKFLDSKTHTPKYQLDAILKFPESTAPEGQTRLNPKTTLDSLYTSILQAAFEHEDPDVDSKFRTIVGTIVSVVNPISPSAIAELIGLDLDHVMLFLALIQSLLAMGDESDKPVKPFHKSFPDFIVDPSRCADPRFCLSPQSLHHKLAKNCFRMMNEGLTQNLLSLQEYTLNSEVEDLSERLDDRVSVALRYACRSWHSHVTKTKGGLEAIAPCLRVFLEEKFLEWLEVLSLLGEVGEAVAALENVISWLQVVPLGNQLLHMARDFLNFVTTFFEPINFSAMHIYHSALELCPTSSTVRELYYYRNGRAIRPPRLVIGTPDSWDPFISISAKDCNYEFCTWSPCSRFVAARTRSAIEIRNHLTFELLTILQPPESTSRLTGPLAYSPDGHSLACISDTTIVLWDIQTGGVAREIGCGCRAIALAWSLDGRTIGVLGRRETPGSQMRIATYEVSSGTASFSEMFQSGEDTSLWACDQSFWVMTVAQFGEGRYITLGINIFELGTTLAKIHSFCRFFGGKTDPGDSVMVTLSPTTSRISVSAGRLLCVFRDADGISGHLLSEPGCFLSCCFSSDGSFFAASEKDSFHVWKYEFDSYCRYRTLQCQNCTGFSLAFSPTPSFILLHSGSVLQVWRLDDPPHTPQSHHRSQQALLSPSRSYVVAFCMREKDVTITNIYSRAASELISMDLGVKEVFLTGNVLLVAIEGKVVAWLLTEDGLAAESRSGGGSFQRDGMWEIRTGITMAVTTDKVGSEIAEIRTGEVASRAYHTITGRLFEPSWKVPQDFDHHRPTTYSPDRYNPLQFDAIPKSGSPTPRVILREGWARDLEGRHRLWIPSKWREASVCADWLCDRTMRFKWENRPVIIKF